MDMRRESRIFSPDMPFKIACLGVGLLFSLSATAQNPIRVGVYGGINLTNVLPTESHSVLEPTPVGPDREGKEYIEWFNSEQMGFQAGLMGLIPINDQISVVPMLLYMQHHFRYDVSQRFVDTLNPDPLVHDQRFRHQLRYLQIPIMLRWDMLPNRFSPFVQAGAYAGLLVDGQKSLDERLLPESQLPQDNNEGFVRSQSGPGNDALQSFDAGMLGGLGLRWRGNILEVGLMVNFRWELTAPVLDSRRYANAEGWASSAMDVYDAFSMQHLEAGLYLLVTPGGGGQAAGNWANCSFGSNTKKRRRRN